LRSPPQQNWGFLFPNMSHQTLSVSPQLAVELQVSVWNIKHVRLSSNYPEIGGSNLTCCVKDNWFAVAKFTNSLPIYLIILFGSNSTRVEMSTHKVVKIAILTRHGKPHINSDRKNGS
jgi:hypothetical protein